MFTGIIQGLGLITAMERRGGEYRLGAAPRFEWDEPLVMGESISVSGACLTVAEINGAAFTAHVSAETVSKTTLQSLKRGALVNLERALKLSDRLGGHLVTGHVDGLGVIRGRVERDQSLVFTFGLDPKLARLLVEKGSAAVDGISLTVNQVMDEAFTVNIIPHTAAATTLGFKKPGDYVNLETDLLGKYVARFLGRDDQASPAEKIDLEFLAENGFL